MGKLKTFKYAFVRSLPIMAGYIVLGLGFGVLLQSKGYANPRDAAGTIAALKQQGAAALAGVMAQLEALDSAQQQAAEAALQQLLEAAQD